MFSEKYKFIAKYLEGYKALVQSVTLKEKYIFDISKTPEIYLNIIYDENGKVKEIKNLLFQQLMEHFQLKLYLKKTIIYL